MLESEPAVPLEVHSPPGVQVHGDIGRRQALGLVQRGGVRDVTVPDH